MLNRLSSALFVACVVLAYGCASVPTAAPDVDESAKAFRTDPSLANIYVYRNERFFGAANTMPVLIDNLPVGATASKTYIFKQVSPGRHVITSKTETESVQVIDAKAGTNYFLWQEVKLGVFTGNSQLHLVDEATGKTGVSECKLVH